MNEKLDFPNRKNSIQAFEGLRIKTYIRQNPLTSNKDWYSPHFQKEKER